MMKVALPRTHGTSQNWNHLEENGQTSKGKKTGRFYSRLKGEKPQPKLTKRQESLRAKLVKEKEQRLAGSEKRSEARNEKAKFKVVKSKTSVGFQVRGSKGHFGRKLEISNSLAEKLGL